MTMTEMTRMRTMMIMDLTVQKAPAGSAAAVAGAAFARTEILPQQRAT
jgi:hypothetical protein